jgi:glucosamine kinase
VDAGGTKADFLIADDAVEIARARVDSIKVLRTQPDSAEARFREALGELERASGVSVSQVARTCIGASGLSVPAVAKWIREQHAKHVGGELVLCGDEEIAFEAAFEEGRGVLALAGTGSNVIGRTAPGNWVRAGGWGPVVGDEGSGHWIGLEAVRAVFRAVDQGATTMLENAILERWKLGSRGELIQQGNSADYTRYAELTPVVVQCALAGDEAAQNVLRDAGNVLAEQVATVIGRILAEEKDTVGLPEVAVAGSILQSVAEVREPMTRALRICWPEIVVRTECFDPVLGALRRARRNTA